HWLKLTKVTSSFLTLMVILSRLKDEEMVRIKMKNPPLDQTGGPREDELEKNLSQPVHQRKRHHKSTGKLTKGSKSLYKSVGESAHAEEPMHTAKDLEEPAHQEFETGATEDQPVNETPQPSNWFQPTRLPSPDHDWNKNLPADHGPVQPRLSNLAQEEGPRESFDKLMDTLLDFSAFMMNQLKVDTLTPELLAGPTFELMKGTCKRQQYPYDLRKPLPLIPNSRGHQVIQFDHFINNDLAYLSGGVSSQTYATSFTKTKATDYGHIKWIEDLGRKRQQFYGFAANRESARDVYSKRRIIVVTKLQIVEWHDYKHLDWITVRRDDDKLYNKKKKLHSRKETSNSFAFKTSKNILIVLFSEADNISMLEGSSRFLVSL
ncbi:hypothetical protein Tco_0822367, partial [Tanacetum coccineum]